jgi:RNA-directed DNA polymerase
MRARTPKAARSTGGGTGTGRQTATARGDSSGPGALTLIEQVVRRENLLAAHARVVQNAGAPGVDGMTVDELLPYCRTHWARLREQLLSGTYVPQPVRRVDIPKPDGRGTRTLGIPTVLDRFIQQALHQVLTPLFDPTFSEDSFGFRPGRSAHDAVRRARRHVADGSRWVVDMDLEQFFDRVNHDVLMARVARRVKDPQVLRLIRRFLQAGMMDEGLVSPRTEGTPQGGPLSPLLSNILLDEWDRELEARGHRFARYADDCNVYVRSQAAGERVLASLERWLWQRLRLRLNREKSHVARPWARKFLGYSVTWERATRLRVAPAALQRLKARVRQTIACGRGRRLADTVAALSRYFRGWVAYFRWAEVKSSFEDLDKWVRRKLRGILWRQWKRPRTRLRELRRRGLDPARARASACNGRGPWWNAGASHMHAAVPSAELRQLGLVSLLEEHQRLQRSA